MHEKLKEKINDIAFMLVMVHESDPTSVEIVTSLCRELAELVTSDPEQTRLATATSYVISQSSSGQIVPLLNKFVAAANAYVHGDDSIVFPNESAPQSSSSPSETNELEGIDRTFLTEYIEAHTMGLDDLEGAALRAIQGEIPNEELLSSVKAYLHNLKGDSGAIGLKTMESVCHALEDSLDLIAIEDTIANLLQFKHWAQGLFEVIAAGNNIPESGEHFLARCKLVDISNHLSTGRETETLSKGVAAPQSSPVATHPGASGPYALAGETDLLVDFVLEAEEHLNHVEGVILDSGGEYSRDSLDTIFRGVHSLKGGSAYFEIQEMTKVSHLLENYLSEVRDGRRSLDSPLRGLLLRYIDLQKDVLRRAKKAAACSEKMVWTDSSKEFLHDLEEYGQGRLSTNAAATPNDALREEPSEVSVNDHADAASSGAANSEGDKGDKLAVKTFVKVDTTRLDLLIDSIGEMVIYSSMLIKYCRELLPNHENVRDATHRVEKFARDLQDIGMSMRLIPIKGLFQKMSRLVWDVGRKLQKDVVFVTDGEETELDRNLIDKLADPLMHMVRNSMDHGIETPEERVAKGKPRAGQVKLEAFHAGGSIHIRISDDGRGLDPEKLIKKAIEKGIIDEGQRLSREEAFQLIFAPGFSTAAAVTDISGRGVGMDVVRRNVENLRGRINIASEREKGSTFTIEIPLTLAILDGIQTKVGQETLVIPSLSIIEFVRPDKGMVSHTLDRGETLNLRGTFLPVYRLGRLFGIDTPITAAHNATLVIVQSNSESVVLMVDEILGECSTVIKSLGGMFEEQEGITGCAIMPGGNISLILDIPSLIQLARKSYRFDPSRDDTEYSAQELQH